MLLIDSPSAMHGVLAYLGRAAIRSHRFTLVDLVVKERGAWFVVSSIKAAILALDLSPTAQQAAL